LDMNSPHFHLPYPKAGWFIKMTNPKVGHFD